jgi:hypothetical protein
VDLAHLRESSTCSEKGLMSAFGVPSEILQSLPRRGKWTQEEEEYADKIRESFQRCVLNIPRGTTLRTYLSKLLNCDPMRITKKFTKDDSVGKQVYMGIVGDESKVIEAEIMLEEYKQRWFKKLFISDRNNLRKEPLANPNYKPFNELPHHKDSYKINEDKIERLLNELLPLDKVGHAIDWIRRVHCVLSDKNSHSHSHSSNDTNSTTPSSRSSGSGSGSGSGSIDDDNGDGEINLTNEKLVVVEPTEESLASNQISCQNTNFDPSSSSSYHQDSYSNPDLVMTMTTENGRDRAESNVSSTVSDPVSSSSDDCKSASELTTNSIDGDNDILHHDSSHSVKFKIKSSSNISNVKRDGHSFPIRNDETLRSLLREGAIIVPQTHNELVNAFRIGSIDTLSSLHTASYNQSYSHLEPNTISVNRTHSTCHHRSDHELDYDCDSVEDVDLDVDGRWPMTPYQSSSYAGMHKSLSIGSMTTMSSGDGESSGGYSNTKSNITTRHYTDKKNLYDKWRRSTSRSGLKRQLDTGSGSGSDSQTMITGFRSTSTSIKIARRHDKRVKEYETRKLSGKGFNVLIAQPEMDSAVAALLNLNH